MTSARQPKLKTSLRVWAVFCLIAWVFVTAHCSTEVLFGHSQAGHSHGHAEQPNHQNDTASAQGESGQSHESKNDSDNDDSCCANLQTVTQTASSFVVLKTDFGKLAPLHFVLLAHALTFVEPETSPPRQAKSREWVFTPEVCLGPAFRAHAPPLYV